MIKISKKGECIRTVSNFSLYNNEDKFDKSNIDINRFVDKINITSPKLKELIKTINILDEYDMNNYNTLYKHVIYTDIKKSSVGSKLVAMGLLSNGFSSIYDSNLRINDKLSETPYDNFALLTSGTVYDKNISVKLKKRILNIFNNRTSNDDDNNLYHNNVNGINIRFIIIDQGYKEGIDLLDVKYIHLLEPLITEADEKQVIGRGTRMCGQKGLNFHPGSGWQLHVFKYDVYLDDELKRKYNVDTLNDLFINNSGVELNKLTFSKELEKISKYGAIDYYLNMNIHGINQNIESIEENEYLKYRLDNYNKSSKLSAISSFQNGGSNGLFLKFRDYIKLHFSQYKWELPKIENNCIQKQKKNIDLSPSQNFVSNFFNYESTSKGLFLWHSVGTGKTCSAISIASKGFEPYGYTILWVTRHTLKSDIWKNMFVDVCSDVIKQQILNGLKLPKDAIDNPYKYLSDAWVQPISYKQFSNMLEGKNDMYNMMVKRNGKEDILRKTLVIIDEVHKLYATDLPLLERPNVNVIKNKIKHSYTVSGKDSVKLLLMSATPYTTNPMDLIKFINFMKENNEIPENFEIFQHKYLDNSGKFTDMGAVDFLDDITPYISYLNRENDVRQFAYPIYYDVLVNISKKQKNIKNDMLMYIEDLKKNIKNIKDKQKKKNTPEYTLELSESLNNHTTLLIEAKQKLKDIIAGIYADDSQEYAIEKCFQK